VARRAGRPAAHHGVGRAARGVVLVAVLLVTVLVTMIAAGLMFRMRAEVATSSAAARGEQAYEAARSGLACAALVLHNSAGDMATWYDNPEVFQNQLVADDGANRWYFTVYAEDPTETTPVRYGLTDEAGKVNLNIAPPETLMALKSMTAELVACLLDYRDTDSEPRPDGAEQEYYDSLAHPYVIPNQSLSTMDELLLVKGFTGQVIYGENSNISAVLGARQTSGAGRTMTVSSDGTVDRGLRAVATVFTGEPGVDMSGKRRVDLNTEIAAGSVSLPAETLLFIRLYRAEGNTFIDPSQLLEMKYTLKQAHPDAEDLKVGAAIESGVKAEQLPVVMDRLTTKKPTGTRRLVEGLVNVNTAPAEVLAVLPGLDASLAQQIVDLRKDLPPETKSTIAWLYTQNLLEAEAFKKAAPFLTARSYQYAARCIGFGVPCGRYRVLEAVLDLSGGTPRVAYLRDITRLGLPFALDTDVVESKR
jgi:type II secretory pathway component PulK